jgi:valyl-tRNA synthetase
VEAHRIFPELLKLLHTYFPYLPSKNFHKVCAQSIEQNLPCLNPESLMQTHKTLMIAESINQQKNHKASSNLSPHAQRHSLTGVN